MSAPECPQNAEDRRPDDLWATADACTACGACDAVCPVAARMDVTPAALIQLVRSDQVETAEKAASLWECLDCRRCSAACGAAVDVYRLVNALRAVALTTRGIGHPYARWHQEFVKVVEKKRRFALGALWMRLGVPRRSMGLAIYRFLKGKAPLSVRGSRPPGQSAACKEGS